MILWERLKGFCCVLFELSLLLPPLKRYLAFRDGDGPGLFNLVAAWLLKSCVTACELYFDVGSEWHILYCILCLDFCETLNRNEW